MTHRVILEPSFILHKHAYGNTSWILNIFSQQHGRLAILARGARQPGSRYQGILDILMPLALSWSGRSNLKYLNQVEFIQNTSPLTGTALFCAFYLNELLMRLLPLHDPYPALFIDYQNTLVQLGCSHKTQALRRFEKRLLQDMGYALSLQYEAHHTRPIEAEYCYQYYPDRGFVRCKAQAGPTIFPGTSLVAMRYENWKTLSALQDAKRLMRLAMTSLLGKRPLKSYDLLKDCY